MGGRARLGCVRGQDESLVGIERHGFEHEAQAADGGMAELLAAAAVQAHVVGRPQGAELLAAGGQLADEGGEGLAERVAARFGAQQRDGGGAGRSGTTQNQTLTGLPEHDTIAFVDLRNGRP